jgi:hypothetical protein
MGYVAHAGRAAEAPTRRRLRSHDHRDLRVPRGQFGCRWIARERRLSSGNETAASQVRGACRFYSDSGERCSGPLTNPRLARFCRCSRRRARHKRFYEDERVSKQLADVLGLPVETFGSISLRTLAAASLLFPYFTRSASSSAWNARA